MTVASANSYIQYAADGVTKTFTVPFYFLLNSDIAVQISDADGNVTDLVNGTHFSVTGAGNAGGGSATLNVAYGTGYTILVYRNPPVTQETVYYENGKFPAKSHEKALDKLTMLIQKFGWMLDVLALKKPSILSRYYDAKNNRISNLANPVNSQDATTKFYVDSADNEERAARIAADGYLQRQLTDEVAARVEGDINTLQKANLYTDTQIAGNLSPNITNVGFYVPSTVSIFSLTSAYAAIGTRGFYTSNDGGDAIWVNTGIINSARAGRHVPIEGKVYDANGREYAINILSGKVSILANGAVRYTYAQCKDDTTDNYVCVGEVIRGITAQLPPAVYESNNEETYTGINRLIIDFEGIRTRFGKTHIRKVSGCHFLGNGARLIFCAGPSTKFSVTGKRIDGLSHGYDEIKEKSLLINNQAYWGSVSLQDFKVSGLIIIGDHSINKMASECTSGVGNMTLNPEGEICEGLYVKNFNWARVKMPAQIEATIWNQQGHAFDNNTLDYRYIMDFWVDAGITSRRGNFNRVTETGCKYESGRRGVYRNACDWSADVNCEIINRLAWRNPGNVSGNNMEYIGVLTGTSYQASGCYLGPAAAKDYNAANGSFFGTAQNHIFTGCYTEWTYNFYTIAKWGFNGKANRLQSFKLDCVSIYKDNFTEYSQIRFEGGCFGTIDLGGNYTYPEGFTHYDTPTGQTSYSIGSPSRDLGAFRHNGYDFKYGPYNMYLLPGSDWESWRDRPYSREMFNGNGMQLNDATALIMWQLPAVKSMACIWYYDHSGNFDPQNVVAWPTAAGQEGPANTDSALYKSFAEKVIDFGNGYKMMMVSQKRLSAWDGLYTFSRNATIAITVPAATPITLKAIEAYTGGVPIFPNGCGNYIPEAPATSVLSSVNNIVGFDSSVGGGLFFTGDVVGPWVHMKRDQSSYRITPTLTSGYNLNTRMVQSGITLEPSFKVAFSATVDAVPGNNTTTITIPAAQLPYVAVGIPLYVTGGSSTGVTGQVHLIKRIMNADGTASSQYILGGNLGAVGDTLTIDQSQLPAYSFFNDRAFGAVSATTGAYSGLVTGSAFRGSNDIGVGYNGNPGTKSIGFYYSGGTTTTQLLSATSTSGMNLAAGGDFSVTGNIYGSADNAYSAGKATNRFTQVWAVNSAINTSNKLKKTGLRNQTDAETNAFYEIGQLPGVWQWLDKYMTEGDDARLHSGPTVQDAIAVMERHGLDWTRYSAFVHVLTEAKDPVVVSWDAEYKTVPAQNEVVDDDGNVITEATEETKVLIRDAGSIVVEEGCEAYEDFAFRKEELLFSISRATIAKQQEIEGRLSSIEMRTGR